MELLTIKVDRVKIGRRKTLFLQIRIGMYYLKMNVGTWI